MNTNISSISTRIKVGLFGVVGLVLIFMTTVLVNDRPYWWRACQLVHINVEDATGLKTKSPVRSLGLEIGYLRSVHLSETHVDLGICITAPVEVLPSTRAYIRGEGFLGDKFVELKPVKYVGEKEPAATATSSLSSFFFSEAMAAEPAAAPSPAAKGGRQIPVGENSQDVQAIVNRVDSLVNEMTGLTNNLRQAINPEELRSTMKQLNRTLENASKTLSPEGGLNQTAQRTLAKLEDAIEQLRDQLTRVNQGKGSVGMLLNDPTYADEIREAIRNVNRLLSKVGGIQFFVDIGAEKIRGYDGGRAWLNVAIHPKPDRYYKLGIAVDPRGRRTTLRSKTCVTGGACSEISSEQIEETGILLTGMFGQTFFENRLDLAIGAIYSDGAISGAVNFGPPGHEDYYQLKTEVYSRGSGAPIDARVYATIHPLTMVKGLQNVYVRGGVESFREVNGKTAWSGGAGLRFEDEDIKLLFAFR